MDSADHLLQSGTKSSGKDLDEEKLLLKPNTTRTKCDIVNECQIFIKAEDGSGDAQMKSTNNLKQGENGKIILLKLFMIL